MLAEYEEMLQERLDAVGALRAELLHVLMLPDFERAGRIGESYGYPGSRASAELLIDCEEDRTFRRCSSGCCARWIASGRSRSGRSSAALLSVRELDPLWRVLGLRLGLLRTRARALARGETASHTLTEPAGAPRRGAKWGLATKAEGG
jgi:hypothetical protein